MRFSAFFAYPSSTANFRDLLTFGPSADLIDYLPTMTSADFWQFSRALLHGLPYRSKSSWHICQTSPGKSDSLHPMYPPHLLNEARAVLDFVLIRRLVRSIQPHMRFLFIGSGLCRRLPSDSTSRWTPLPLASGSHCQAHSGLSPPSYRPCRAHHQQKRPWLPMAFFCVS